MKNNKNGIAGITSKELLARIRELESDMSRAVNKFHSSTGAVCTGIEVDTAAHTGSRGRDALVIAGLTVSLDQGHSEYLRPDEPEEPELSKFNDMVAHRLIEKANSLFVGTTFKYAVQLSDGEVVLHSGIPGGERTTYVNVGKFQEHPMGSESSLYRYTD